MRTLPILLLLALLATTLRAQETVTGTPGDTTALDSMMLDTTMWHTPISEDEAQSKLQLLGPGWGYTFDSLGKSLERWSVSPLVTLDTIGWSVQTRPIIEMRIAEATAGGARQTVYIHARTHPGEVESFRVAEQIIEQLLRDDEPVAVALRRRLVFRIIPMYNPDGVELGYGRENANQVDLEREWDKQAMQPEAAALRNRFLQFMNGNEPIAVALNMHSAYDCLRYFYYHDASSTSDLFAQRQQTFIEGVRLGWPEGIEPWNYRISWVDNRPTHFPESFWWERRGAEVMALTYEDMNCAAAGDYDSTARTMLQGIAGYLGISASVRSGDAGDAGFTISTPTPQPAREYAEIGYILPTSGSVTVELRDALGRMIDVEDRGRAESGSYIYRWQTASLAPGVYFCTIRWNDSARTARVVVAK